jgi:positive phototaxis protein PixI
MTANTTLVRLQQLLPQLFQPLDLTGDPYLRFQLTPEIPALLSMERVQEALLVPAQGISPLPNLPAFTIGMMSARDRVFCVVDLGQLLGFPSLLANPRNYQIIVINFRSLGTESGDVSEKSLGLAVLKVSGVARFETKPLPLLAENCPTYLEPYLLGSLTEKNRQIFVLNPESIATSPRFGIPPFTNNS